MARIAPLLERVETAPKAKQEPVSSEAYGAAALSLIEGIIRELVLNGVLTSTQATAMIQGCIEETHHGANEEASRLLENIRDKV